MMFINGYEIKIENEYIYITTPDGDFHYQLKLESEGLVLDVVSEDTGVMMDLFDCMNETLDIEEA